MGLFKDLFGKSPRVAVVEAFSENPSYDLSVPDIIKMSGICKRSIYTHIRKLINEGILIKTDKKEGKCLYYKFNPIDPRGEALIFLENVLKMGTIEKELKISEGIPLTMPLPSEKYPIIRWKIHSCEENSIHTSIGGTPVTGTLTVGASGALTVGTGETLTVSASGALTVGTSGILTVVANTCSLATTEISSSSSTGTENNISCISRAKEVTDEVM
jgi:hypothetical protein